MWAPTDATVWVETDGPCQVEILGFTERTWCVAGHHYALVGDRRPAGRHAAPPTRSGWTASRSGRCPGPPGHPAGSAPGARVRWCRSRSAPAGTPRRRRSCRTIGSTRTCWTVRAEDRRAAGDQWPHALIMLGDQVYADETSPQTQERIRQRRDIARAPGEQVADFEEYTWLYSESWTDPEVRWLLSTVPSVDDLRRPRRPGRLEHLASPGATTCSATGWWQERIVGGAGVVLGVPAPGQPRPPPSSAENELYQRVRAARRGRRAWCASSPAADREADGAKGARWSYRRDFGRCGCWSSTRGAAASWTERAGASMLERRRVRLDRRATLRRLRAPADRHVTALAAAPGVPRHRGLERVAVRRPSGPRWSRRLREDPPGRRISSTGRPSASRSSGSRR